MGKAITVFIIISIFIGTIFGYYLAGVDPFIDCTKQDEFKEAIKSKF